MDLVYELHVDEGPFGGRDLTLYGVVNGSVRRFVDCLVLEHNDGPLDAAQWLTRVLAREAAIPTR